jgi:proteasome lid subunit RPN8/RPN11
MTDTRFLIPRKLVLAILHHIQTQPEQEVCGLVGGDPGKAASYYPVDNIDPLKTNRFTLDGAGQIAALKTMRSRSETLVAIFHSHPHTTAQPSSLDIALGGHSGVLSLIGSTGTRGVLELRGYRLDAAENGAEVELLMGDEG